MGGGHEAQGVEHQVGDLVVPVHEENHLVVVLRPRAVEQVVLVLHLPAYGLAVFAGQQLLPHVHLLVHAPHGGEVGGVVPAVHGGHGGLHQLHDVAFDDLPVLVLGVDVKGQAIAVAQGGQIRNAAPALVQPGFEILQVVGLGLGVNHGVEHVVHHRGGVDPVPVVSAVPPVGPHKGHQHIRHVRGLRLDGDGIAGEGLLLDLVDVGVDPGGEGENEGDADDADGPGEAGQQGAALLGHKVVQG